MSGGLISQSEKRLCSVPLVAFMLKNMLQQTHSKKSVKRLGGGCTFVEDKNEFITINS